MLPGGPAMLPRNTDSSTFGGYIKTNLILGVFLVRQYDSAPLVGQFGEGA